MEFCFHGGEPVSLRDDYYQPQTPKCLSGFAVLLSSLEQETASQHEAGNIEFGIASRLRPLLRVPFDLNLAERHLRLKTKCKGLLLPH